MSKSSPAEALAGLVKGVTDRWAKQRRAEIRSVNAVINRLSAMSRIRDVRVSTKAAAFDSMEEAYLIASAPMIEGGPRLPATARQIYYAIRKLISETIVANSAKFKQSYFNKILHAYIEEHEPDWDVVYDDRGHAVEPHTDRSVGLGTLNVRDYLNELHEPLAIEAGFSPARIDTCGPFGQFGAILFVEKEGFSPLLAAARVAERFDVMIASTKGLSNIAVRRMIDALNVPVAVLHDFDISGFTIFGTLKMNTARYAYTNKIRFVDLGLRLADAKALGLDEDAERVAVADKFSTRILLKRNGANKTEENFLMGGRRIELNAMPARDLVALIERGLTAMGVKKVIPAKADLDAAYTTFAREQAIEEAVNEALEELEHDAVVIPKDLAARVQDRLAKEPTLTWSEAVRAIIRDL